MSALGLTANTRELGTRWLKFNLVGVVGVILQLILLKLFITYGGWHYLAATALAVELTVIHNFCWHQHWTWRERAGNSNNEGWLRLLKFNSTNGMISIVGNLIVMKLLVGIWHIPAQWANLAAIGICSLGNFLVSNGFVFRAQPAGRQRH